MKAFGAVCEKPSAHYTRKLIFPVDSNGKLPCILYTSAHCMRDFTVCLPCNALHKQFLKSELKHTRYLCCRVVFAGRTMTPSMIGFAHQ